LEKAPTEPLISQEVLAVQAEETARLMLLTMLHHQTVVLTVAVVVVWIIQLAQRLARKMAAPAQSVLFGVLVGRSHRRIQGICNA
jgi:glucan phosphoethanolaminetransferase (alkaline phosphatase superfamily)